MGIVGWLFLLYVLFQVLNWSCKSTFNAVMFASVLGFIGGLVAACFLLAIPTMFGDGDLFSSSFGIGFVWLIGGPMGALIAGYKMYNGLAPVDARDSSPLDLPPKKKVTVTWKPGPVFEFLWGWFGLSLILFLLLISVGSCCVTVNDDNIGIFGLWVVGISVVAPVAMPAVSRAWPALHESMFGRALGNSMLNYAGVGLSVFTVATLLVAMKFGMLAWYFGFPALIFAVLIFVRKDLEPKRRSRSPSIRRL